MATKENPGAFDCYAKAEPNEEFFMILSRDSCHAAAVEAWIKAREHELESGLRPDTPDERAQIDDARETLHRMRAQHGERRARKEQAAAAAATEAAQPTA